MRKQGQPSWKKMNDSIDRAFAINVVKRLTEEGFEALWAGGCVRDELLGLVPIDYDVATSARPEQVRKIFPRTVAVGASFGVIDVIGPILPNGKPVLIQVATFRADLGYTDGRRPDAIRYCSAREDALRRDFTINGMFFDPLSGKLVDYVEGQIDLKSKLLRAIGDPELRFAEDRLRMLRAVRIAPRFQLTIDASTRASIIAHSDTLGAVSAERISDELRKIFNHPSRLEGMRLFIELGLAKQVLPEVFKGDETEGGQNILAILGGLTSNASFPLVLASVLQNLSKKNAYEICRRLKLSNSELAITCELVSLKDALLMPEKLRLCELKKLLANPNIQDLLELMQANLLGGDCDLNAVKFCREKLALWNFDILTPPQLIGGEELKELGLKPGPKFKQILDFIRDEQLDGILKTHQQAVLRAKELEKLL